MTDRMTAAKLAALIDLLEYNGTLSRTEVDMIKVSADDRVRHGIVPDINTGGMIERVVHGVTKVRAGCSPR